MKYKLKRYYEEHDDGAAVSERSRGLAALGEIPQETPESVTDEKPETKPAPQVVDAEALAKSFGDVLADRFKQTPAEEKPVELSPEEAKKLLNVWEPTKEWQTRYDNLETREAALAEMRDGVIKQSDTITQFRLREARTAMEKEYKPVLEYVSQVKAREENERFVARYSVFKDPALKDLRTTVEQGLKGQNFANEDAKFDAIAKGMEAVIKVNNADFKLPSAGSSPAETKPKGQTANGIPVTTPGAGGGVAARTTTAPKKRGLAVFD